MHTQTTGSDTPLLDRLTDGLSGLGAMLVVLCVGMVVGSFLVPSPVTGVPRYADLRPSSPVRLVVPALDISAPIVPVPLSATAVLDPPRDPSLVGWWDASSPPGRAAGQTVITGHTVSTGGGAMDRVGTLEPGQRVDVVTRNGTMRYRVSKVRVLAKEQVAEQAVALFGQEGGAGRLVLVSCEDWNGTSYDSNVLVFAQPLGQPIRSRRAATASGA